MLQIKEIRTRDYAQAQRFAIEGMHLNWYVEQKWILALYGWYFWHQELHRATRAYGAYADGAFVGALLADMKGGVRQYHSPLRSALVKAFDRLQHICAGTGVDAYEAANRAMLSSFLRRSRPDGELLFLAADPGCGVSGVGTALLRALEADEPGKLVYLYTDSACTYPFYEHRGFAREEERDVLLELGRKQVPLRCLLYSKRL